MMEVVQFLEEKRLKRLTNQKRKEVWKMRIKLDGLAYLYHIYTIFNNYHIIIIYDKNFIYIIFDNLI